MLRACLKRCEAYEPSLFEELLTKLSSTGSQRLAHSSPLASSWSAGLHTSPTRHAAAKKNIKLSQKAKTEIKEERYLKALASKPSPILGTRPGEEGKWDKCDLAKVLVDESALRASTGPNAPVTHHAFGVSDKSADILLNVLPSVSAEEGLSQSAADAHIKASDLEMNQDREKRKEELFERVIDLRNADAKGIAFENRRRIIHAFSTPENPWDTGRVEVQGTFAISLSSS
jgi:small subunit ribosomal protein S15